jgi:hypothetical protein
MKEYLFSTEEVTILRNAMEDYAYHLTPGADASKNRVANHRLATALKEQFINDLRAMKGI